MMAREFPAGRFENGVESHMLFPHVEPMLESEPAGEELLGEWAQGLSSAASYM